MHIGRVWRDDSILAEGPTMKNRRCTLRFILVGAVFSLCLTRSHPSAMGAASEKPRAHSQELQRAVERLQSANVADATQNQKAALDDIFAHLNQKIALSNDLVSALIFAQKSHSPQISRLASECLLLLTPLSARATEAMARELIEDYACETDDPIKQKASRLDDAGFIPLISNLRKIATQSPGVNHRISARSALAELLIMRVMEIRHLPCPPERSSRNSLKSMQSPNDRDATRRWRTILGLQESGAAGELKALLNVFRDAKSDDQVPERLLAAFALQSTQIIPDASTIKDLSDSLKEEKHADAQREMLLALATFAEKSTSALKELEAHLLNAPCEIAEAVAINIPADDLKLVLFKHFAKSPADRARSLRRWLRTDRFKICDAGR